MTVFPARTETDSFVIRKYTADDGPALRHATNASYEHLKRYMPWATDSQSAVEANELAAFFDRQYVAGTDFVLGVWNRDETQLIGGTGFHLREGPLRGRCAEVGMWIHADHAGKGLGKAVLRQLLRWGFTEWDWLRLSWRCDEENIASIRVAEAVGMTHEGTLRGQFDDVTEGRCNTVIYAILRKEWAAGR